jgi:hypothetical protein
MVLTVGLPMPIIGAALHHRVNTKTLSLLLAAFYLAGHAMLTPPVGQLRVAGRCPLQRPPMTVGLHSIDRQRCLRHPIQALRSASHDVVRPRLLASGAGRETMRPNA